MHQPGTRLGGPDRVVQPVAARGPQAGIAEHRLEAVERRPQRFGLGKHLFACIGSHRPVLLVLLIVGGRPGNHPAVERREHQHALRTLCRDRQQDLLRRPGRRFEHEELALARVDGDPRVSRERREPVRVKPSGVDGGRAADDVSSRRLDGDPVAARLHPRHRAPREDTRARRHRGRRQRVRVGDGIGHRLAGHLEGTVLAERDVDAVARRGPRKRADGLDLRRVARLQDRAAAQHRDPELLEHGRSQLGGSQ